MLHCQFIIGTGAPSLLAGDYADRNSWFSPQFSPMDFSPDREEQPSAADGFAQIVYVVLASQITLLPLTLKSFRGVSFNEKFLISERCHYSKARVLEAPWEWMDDRGKPPWIDLIL